MMNYTEIIANQRAFFHSNQTKSLAFRIEKLKHLRQLIVENENDFHEAIYADFKKSAFENFVSELSFVVQDIDEAIKYLKKWSKRKKVRTNLVNLPAKSFIVPEPLGVCLIMGAWNYPFQLSLSPLVAALAAGNTVILKPSEIAANTSALMKKLINAHFPSEYLVVIEGGVTEISQLLEQCFDKIFFTGSSHVGKIVYKAAAEHLTPVTLELGGKSPVIITQSKHLKQTAKRIVWAKFLNAGQTCIAPDYILVEESLKEELLKELVECIKKFDYCFEHQNYVQIINEKNFHRLVNLLPQNRIYYGGKHHLASRYIEPTVLHSIVFEDPIMQEEIFGPLLPVLSFTQLDDVILQIKKQPKPLALYVFTDNKKVKDTILEQISFGGGEINDALMHITNPSLPFGGVGNSGIGNYHGEAGFACFSHYKSVMEKYFFFEPPLKYPPYTNNKMSILRKLLS